VGEDDLPGSGLHWQNLYNAGQARRGLSEKALKVQAFEVADRLLDDVLKYRALPLPEASKSIANTLGFGSTCVMRLADAKVLRDEILQRISAVYRDSSATMAYVSDDCAKGQIAANDLRSIAGRLPD